MKRRKEKEKAVDFVPLDIPEEYCSNNVEIEQILQVLRICESFETQQKHLQMLSKYLQIDDNRDETYNLLDDDQQFVVKLLTYMYLTLNSKLTIQKTLKRLLTNLAAELMETPIVDHLRQSMENAWNVSGDLQMRNKNIVMDIFMTCLENFPPGLNALVSIADSVLTFTSGVLQDLVDHVRLNKDDDKIHTVHEYVHNTVRTMLSLIQKCELHSKLTEISINLSDSCNYIISENGIPFETKSNCGLLLVYAFNNLPSHIVNDFDNVDCPSLELLKCSIPKGFNLDKIGIKNFADKYMVKVAVYSGILNVVPKCFLSTILINDDAVISFILQDLIRIATQVEENPGQTVDVAGVIALVSRNLAEVPSSILDSMFRKCLKYVWSHLDHYVDTVRHIMKTMLTNLVKLAVEKQKENDSLIQLIFNDLKLLPPSSSVQYAALNIMALNISCGYLLSHMELLEPSQMLENLKDPSVAQQVTTLYEYLMEQNFKESSPKSEMLWIDQWVKTILPYIKQTLITTSFYQKLLVKAFKINPVVLEVIMPYQLSNNPAEVRTLLSCLRAARRDNIKISLEATTTKYWRGLIEFDTLETYVFHQDDEIRVLILALIAESQKSTELFTLWEMEFLKKYFYYNITAQVPNTRKQIISLYKKVLLRVKEGLIVIDRMYKKFIVGRASVVDYTAEDSCKTSDIKVCQVNKNSNTINCSHEISAHSARDMSLIKRNYNLYFYFVGTFVKECLVTGLFADANYPRRSAALELLLYYQQNFSNTCWKRVWHKEDIQHLKNIVIYDTYDSNKDMAIAILREISSEGPLCEPDVLKDDFKTSLALVSSIKPSDAMSAAYAFEILTLNSKLSQAIKDQYKNAKCLNPDPLLSVISIVMCEFLTNAKECMRNVYEAAKNISLYGYLNTIRRLFSRADFTKGTSIWTTFTEKLVKICLEIYNAVSPIVHDLAPEGNLPDSEFISTGESDESARAQALLVFAWRTVKEISMFFGESVARAVKHEKDFKVLSDKMLIGIGNYFISVFIFTKHRGVFEQAYIGFCKVCENFWKSTNPVLNVLPGTWLKKVIDLISGSLDHTCKRLCSTRRSAGLPFLILAILTTEPVTKHNEASHTCIKGFTNIASDISPNNDNRRTHSMNILRMIYRNNQMGEFVQPYIAEGVKIAITGFKSPVWGVRNSGTLLYAALVTRIFGVQRTKDSEILSIKNRLTVKVFFMRYPELHKFLLDELQEGAVNEDSLSLYPVLLLLSRLYPLNFGDEASNSKVQGYVPFINICLGNTSYRIRELAAKASVSFISRNDITAEIARLFILLSNPKLHNNLLHGLLLKLLYLLQSVPDNHPKLDTMRLIKATQWILVCTGSIVSYCAGSLYSEIIVLLLSRFKTKVEDDFCMFIELINWQLKNCIRSPVSNAATHYVSSLHYLKLYLFETVLKGEAAEYITLEILDNITFAFPKSIRRFYFNLIIYLHLERKTSVEHSLFITEDLVISDQEYTLVKCMNSELKRMIRRYLHLNLRGEHFVNKDLLDTESHLLALLVIREYPCLLRKLHRDYQQTLDYFLQYCTCDNEELSSAALSCISTLLKNCNVMCLRQLKLNRLMKVLLESAYPAAATYRRLAVCEFLLDNNTLFLSDGTFLSVEQLCNIWNIILMLLEDDEQFVRDTISQLNTKTHNSNNIPVLKKISVISEKAREDLLQICVSQLPKRDAIRFLLKWSVRQKPEDTDDDKSEVFNKGYLNLYSETTPVVTVAANLLEDLLWTLEEGLNYEDKSIFIEEKALLVTTELLDAIRNPNPVISRFPCLTLIHVLGVIIGFLETTVINQPNFKTDFKQLLQAQMNTSHFFKLLNQQDLSNIKILLWTLYSPIVSDLHF